MVVDSGKHYLYRHIRLDNGNPFYIGIGTKEFPMSSTHRQEYKRSYCIRDRNKIWKGIVKRVGYSIEIMLESNDYNFIKQKEQEFIKLYGRISNRTGTLANLTDGGDGCLGMRHSQKVKDDQSKRTFGPLSQEHRMAISRALKGRKVVWAKDSHFVRKLVEILPDGDLIRWGSIDELCKFYKVDKTTVYNRINNPRSKSKLLPNEICRVFTKNEMNKRKNK